VHAFLAAFALCLAGAAPAIAADPAAPAKPPSAAAAPAASPLGAQDLHLPRSGLDLGGLVAPVLLLAGLALAAVFLARRRRAPGRRVVVLETTSLGQKRSLVLAQLEDEVLLLGSSEAGIQLLKSCPAEELAESPAPSPGRKERERSLVAPAALKGLVARLRRVHPAPKSLEDFDDLLSESSEDQDLRAKLARGQTGSVR
jgi:flagellar biogenesis protein FliO